jgi:hypothetical protein
VAQANGQSASNVKYLGKDTYPFRQPIEVRVMYEIEPTASSGMG